MPEATYSRFLRGKALHYESLMAVKKGSERETDKKKEKEKLGRRNSCRREDNL